MKRLNERRSLLARMVFTLVGGCLYVSLLIEPACVNDDNNAPPIDASSGSIQGLDATAGSLDAPASSPDAPATQVDAPATTLSDCWTQAVAAYANPDPNCNIPNTTLSISGNQITLTPFGENASVNFTPKPGTPNEATASGLIIFSAGEHTCTITCIPGATAAQTTISTACTNPEGGSCNQPFNRN